MLQVQQGEVDAILMYKRLKTSVITAASQCEKFVTYGRNPVHCKKINSQMKDLFTRFNMLLLFPLKPHFNELLHVLVKVHWRRSNVDLFKGFLDKRIFVTADCIR